MAILIDDIIKIDPASITALKFSTSNSANAFTVSDKDFEITFIVFVIFFVDSVTNLKVSGFAETELVKNTTIESILRIDD